MRVLLLAPVGVAGGIATWEQVFSSETRHQAEVLDTNRGYMTLGAHRPVRRVILGALTAFVRIIKCRRLVRQQRHDVVYITCAPSLGLWLRDFPLLFVLGRFGVPIVVHLHGGDSSRFFGRSSLLRWISIRAFKRASLVVVITRDVQDLAETLLGTCRVRFVPNGISSSFLKSAIEHSGYEKLSTPTQVIHVGAQCLKKGTLEVLEVAARVPNAKFILVGPVPDDFRPVLEARMAVLGLSSTVTFTGVLRGEDLRLAYARASLMLFPSHGEGEGFPMVVLEAMAHGLPVVATDVAAIPEMLSSQSDAPAGYVVTRDEWEIENLTRRVVDLVSSPNKRRKLGANGQQRVESEYSANRVVAHLDELIECVVRREPLILWT